MMRLVGTVKITTSGMTSKASFFVFLETSRLVDRDLWFGKVGPLGEHVHNFPFIQSKGRRMEDTMFLTRLQTRQEISSGLSDH